MMDNAGMTWRWPVMILIAVNSIPLYGVLVIGWDVFSLLLLYWLESAVVGLYTILKLRWVKSGRQWFTTPFFMVHFGMFMVVHLILIGALIPRTASVLPLHSLMLALVSLVASHGVSFITNFLGRQEYAFKTASEQMLEPYRRVVVMHVAIVFGAWLGILIGSSAGVMVVLVLTKIGLDIRAHLREHARFYFGNHGARLTL